MRLGIIDLGTNSVRFDVHEIGPDGQVFGLHREKLMIRLGEGVFLHRRLNQRSRNICIEAFLSFKKTIKDFKVHRVIAFATSALREAKDSDRLIREIEKKSGIRVRIISGDEEARLIARGILANEKGIRGNTALVDIGGGSTEVIVCSGREVQKRTSFELGTARLQQIFLKTIPPVRPASGALHPIESLRRHIRGTLLFRLVSENWPKCSRLLGASGTTKALLKIIKRRTTKNFIDRDSLHELIQEMGSMPRSELLRIPGMESRRVDMILAGAVLLEECMLALNAETVETTDFSLRDGILDEQVEILSANARTLAYDPIEDFLETAVDLGGEKQNLKVALQLAGDFFDRLKGVHRLESRWRLYLEAASLIYDSGRSISAIDSDSHAAYVARYADVPAFDPLESELISELALYARDGKIAKRDLPFKKRKDFQLAFIRLLPLLRLVAALSYQRSSKISIERVKTEKRRIVISISKRSRAPLQILRADQRKSLFEEVFKKSLTIEEV